MVLLLLLFQEQTEQQTQVAEQEEAQIGHQVQVLVMLQVVLV